MAVGVLDHGSRLPEVLPKAGAVAVVACSIQGCITDQLSSSYWLRAFDDPDIISCVCVFAVSLRAIICVTEP